MIWRLTWVWLLLANAAFAQEEPRQWYGISPFEMQGFVAAERRVVALIRRGNQDAALNAFDQLIMQYPRVPRVHVNRAIILARSGQAAQAIDGLEEAARLGFEGFSKLAGDPALAKILATDRGRALLDDAPVADTAVIFSPAIPAIAKANQLVVTQANVDYLPKSDMLLIRTSFPERPFSPSVSAANTPWASRINQLHASGVAAGNHGDMYENRDGGHSKIKLKEFPQVTKMSYASDIDTAYNLSSGTNLHVIADAIVFGNSSTAYKTRPFARSLVRGAMTQPGAAMRLFTQHRANQIYIYPEVRDFDQGFDRFPGYFADQIMSEGRSGSDKIPLKAVALALAAFRPEVKTELKRRNLISPVVASILRRAVKGGNDPLSDLGHRTAIKGEMIDFMNVIDLAQSVSLDDIPPRVVMRVEDEPKLAPGRNVFAPINSEAIYTTPTSIARRAYGSFSTRTYRLRAQAQTQDPNGFEWRILAGDPKLISITPLDNRGALVEVTVRWHDPFVTAEGETTSRVDIGVFAKSGKMWSNPAVLSVYFPPKETRKHDAEGRLLSVDYADPIKKKTYNDPRLSFLRRWKDEIIYRHNKREGWTRIQGNKRTRYANSGDIVTELDQLDRPIAGRVAKYDLDMPRPGIRRITVTPGARDVRWEYAAPEDRIGKRVISE